MLPTTTPGGLRTPAATKPDRGVVILAVLSAGSRAYLQELRLGAGDTLRCREGSSAGIVIEAPGRCSLLLPLEHAANVQVEWLPRDSDD